MKNKKIVIGICLAMLGGYALTVSAETNGDKGDKMNKKEVQLSQATQEAINQSQDGLVVEQLEDGSEMVDLKGRFQMFSVAKVVDGKVVYSCRDHENLQQHNHAHAVQIKKTERAVK